MNAELKSCPFCGKEMNVNNFFSCDGYPQACGCWEKTRTGEEAIAVWNTRPLEDTLQSKIDDSLKRLIEVRDSIHKKATYCADPRQKAGLSLAEDIIEREFHELKEAEK